MIIEGRSIGCVSLLKENQNKRMILFTYVYYFFRATGIAARKMKAFLLSGLLVGIE
jgi:hypothetical protein